MRKFLMAIVLLICFVFVPQICLANTEITTKTMKRGDSVNVEYPVVSNMEDRKIQKIINQDILKQVREFINTVRVDGVKNLISGNYKVTHNSSDILSIKMDLLVMPDKGAYPTSYVKGFNYDLETGSILHYGDMQRVSLGEVNKSLTKHLQERGIDIPGFSGLDFVPGEFYIDEQGGLVSIIQEGVVGPHAIGVLQFKVF